MPNLTSTLTVRLIDAVTGPARAAANSIRGIGNAVDQTNGRRLAIAGALTNMNREVVRTSRTLSRNVQRMSTGLSLPTGFATWFGAKSVYDFEKISNAFQAVTLATDEQRAALQGYAKELNALFPYTNAQIMEAAFELARAGLTFEQVMGTLRGSLNLGLAGDIDLGESADIATNVLTAMRLPMKTTEQAMESLTRVSDAMAYAAVRSNTDVRMMGETFKYVGPMAAAAGMSIEDVTAAAMIMANNGIRASEAGVALRSALVRMVKPTKPMIRALNALNINLDDFVKRGRQISAQDIITSLQVDGVDATPYAKQIEDALRDPKLKGSLSALTLRLTEIIGGDGSLIDKSVLSDAITDILTAAGSEIDFFGFIRALKEKGADIGHIANVFDARQGSRLITLLAGDIDAVLADVIENAAGSTDRMSRIRMKGVVGEWAALVAATENLFIAIAEAGVLTTARDVIVSITNALTSLAQSNPQLLEFGTYALILAGILGPIGMLLGGVVGGLMSLYAILRLIKAVLWGAGAMTAAGIFGGGAAAGASGAGAAGAAAGVAGAASRGSWWTKLLRGGGMLGTGLLLGDILDMADPEGNLWGLTAGLDAWVERNFGFNPSKIGGSDEQSGPRLTEAEARAADLAEWRARQAEIDARLAQIEANTHPAMRDMPNPERDNLEFERTMLQSQIDAAEAAAASGIPLPNIDVSSIADAAAAATAGTEVGAAFRENLAREIEQARRMVEQQVGLIKNSLSFSANPTVTPRVNGTALRGVHADVGVD